MTNPFVHSFSRGPIINDEAAWERGRSAAIKRNARVGKRARWIAEDATREQLIRDVEQAATSERASQFMVKMFDSLEEWGTLTAGQEAAVRKIFAQNAERAEQRKIERAAEAATSQHVGTVGERIDLTLTMKREFSFETQFGTMVVTILHDAAGNVFVNKGRDLQIEKGATVTLRATIKEHSVRDSLKQTVLSRVKVGE